MIEPEYIFIALISVFISVHLSLMVIDIVTNRPKRSRRVKKEGKWIKIDTSREEFTPVAVTSAGGRGQESFNRTRGRRPSSSRAGYVSLDYTSALQRKRRRGG